MKNKEYALYKGEDIIATGTTKEIAKKMGIQEQTINYYKTQAYINRLERRNTTNGNVRVLVSLEDEDIKNMKTCTSCNEKSPRTVQFFLKNSGFNGGLSDGFQSVCVTCRNKNKNKVKPKKKKEFIKKSIEIFEMGKKYQIKMLDRGKIINYFEGEVIQITKNHITLRSEKHGYCESFKEIDFKIKDYSIQEVI